MFSIKFSWYFPLAILAIIVLRSNVAGEDLTRDSAIKYFSKANQHFSLRLYKKLVNPRENLVVSGFSVATVLAMLLQGSRGLTERALLSTLCYDTLAPGLIEDAYKNVLERTRVNRDYQLSIANSIWVRDYFQISDEFQERVRQVFGAEAKRLKTLTALEDVNKYVAQRTGNLIQDFLKEKPGDNTIMMLMNAIYFKGTWKIQFENDTFPAGFIDNDDETPADIRSAVTRMMRIKEEFSFTDSSELKAEIVELLYKGDEMSMVILLPTQGTTLVELEREITSEKLRRAFDELESTRLFIIMPKFKIESDMDLVDPIAKLGLGEIFTNSANFTGIGPHLQVTEIFQKAIIDVTPEGSKATSVTAGTITRLRPSNRPPPFRVLRIVHPFLFVLRHKPTDTILFMGRYTKSAPFNERES